MPGPVSITYTNGTVLNFDHSDYTDLDSVPGFNTYSKLPTDTLPADQTTEAELTETALSNLANGTFGFSLCWNYKGSDFGVKIFVPYQLLGMGDRPYYEVMYPTTTGYIGWMKPVDDPASPYSFPFPTPSKFQDKLME